MHMFCNQVAPCEYRCRHTFFYRNKAGPLPSRVHSLLDVMVHDMRSFSGLLNSASSNCTTSGQEVGMPCRLPAPVID